MSGWLWQQDWWVGERCCLCRAGGCAPACVTATAAAKPAAGVLLLPAPAGSPTPRRRNKTVFNSDDKI